MAEQQRTGEQPDRTDWRREAELLERTLAKAARRFVQVLREREELRAELARVRAQVAAEIADAIEDDGFGGECCAVYERCAEIARQHAAPSAVAQRSSADLNSRPHPGAGQP